VLIVDVIGELSNWWAVADAGFVGGSMGNRGGQSMIEPAGKGVPVCFGPHTENFKSTVSALIQNDAAEVVHHQRQLESFMKWSMDMPHLAQSMGRRAKQSVARNFGAADRTVAGILGAGYRPQSPPPAKPAVPSAA
jgi:3-deoxy-D-manno-octulosonic-acid transferase